MSNLILYRAFGSPPARAVMMLSELLGLKLQFKDVNILHHEHKSPEFKKLNPMCTVPVLQDNDFVVSESHAIMKYLFSMYGDDENKSLYPSDVRERAIVDQCMFFNAGVFFKALANVGNSSLNHGLDGPTPQNIKDVEAAYSVVDAYLLERPYIATDHLTLADLAAGSTATAIQVIHNLDSDKFPRCAEWMTRLQDEHVFKTINGPGVAFFAKVMQKVWKLNKIKKDKQ